MQLEIADIRQDGGTQPRAMLHAALADEYAEAMREGAQFPPVVVFYDGTSYWLADGFHRVFAAGVAGLTTIEADVRQGTQADAQWYSYSANKAHGKRRSDEDKRRAVEAALAHPKAATMSEREIAAHVGVSHMTVNRMRNDAKSTVTELQSPIRTGRDGRTINTANIGKTKRDPKPAPPNPHIGGSFDEFLKDEGIYDEVDAAAELRLSAFTPFHDGPEASNDDLDDEVMRLKAAYSYDSFCRLVKKMAEAAGLEVRE